MQRYRGVKKKNTMFMTILAVWGDRVNGCIGLLEMAEEKPRRKYGGR